MSPVEDFKGPKTPSNRQVLRLFLHFVAIGYSLQVAAREVVTQVLGKHTSSISKSPRRPQDDVLSLYKESRFSNQQLIGKFIAIVIVVVVVVVVFLSIHPLVHRSVGQSMGLSVIHS